MNHEHILLTNGCSMCYGSELFDDSTTKQCTDNQARFATAWPGVLGRELGVDRVVNLGYPGGSNDRIFRTTMEWILKNGISSEHNTRNIFVVIGWSAPMRREFYIDAKWQQLIPYQDYHDPSASLMNRVYRELAWNEYESGVRFATQIIALQAFLKSHKIPYLFFDAIIPFAQTNINCSNRLDYFVPHIVSKNYFNFKNGSCMATSLNKNSTNLDRRHPSDTEHETWAHDLKTYIQAEKIFPSIRKDKNPSPLLLEGTYSVETLFRKVNAIEQPLSKHNFNRENECDQIVSKKNKQGLLTKIQRALRRDPFIYD